MNVDATHKARQQAPDLNAGIVRRAVQVFVTLAIQAAILFLAAGRLDWVWAWVFIGLYLAGVAVNASFMLRYSPETVAVRSKAKGIKVWDMIFGGLFAIMYFVAVPLIAGLDVRFGWTGPIALAVHLAGAVAFALGFALLIWAMASNAYFATIVRIQEDRGHTVCDTGPYRFVRHPGYVSAIIHALAVPLLLGSPWALIPGVVGALALVVRTALEDRTLHDELDGYGEYAQRVRYRLLPGVW